MPAPRPSWLKSLLLISSLALLSGVVFLGATSGSSTTQGRLTISAEPSAAHRTYALLTGIPQHGAVLGYRKAPVTLQFFGDLQCMDSRRVMLGALPFLIRHWVRAGKLQIRFRSTETDTVWAGGWFEFREQQSAAMAAGRQGKLWNFVSVFYREQGPEFTGYVDDAFLKQIAMGAGLDLQRWLRDRVPFREAAIDLIDADERLATEHHLRTTPSFLIGRTGGPVQRLRHFSLEEPKVFDEAIKELL
jgi:protein-disulfide isomerase